MGDKVSNKCLSCPCYSEHEKFDERFHAEKPGGGMGLYGEIIEIENYCSWIDGHAIEPDEFCEVNIIKQEQADRLYISFSESQVELIQKILNLEVEI